MKKTLIFLLSLSLSVFAQNLNPTSIDCKSHPSFNANACEVCYEETRDATGTNAGWKAVIEDDIRIPWKHLGGDLAEMIYDDEQGLPELVGTIKASAKPQKSEDLWGYHENIVWKPFPDHKEFFIEKGGEVGLFTFKDGGMIQVEGKGEDTLLFTVPLKVRDFDAKTNEESSSKTRKICLLEKFTPKANPAPAVQNTPSTPPVQNTSTPSPNTPDTPVNTPHNGDKNEDIPVLNAAGPEPESTTTKVDTKISAEQTQTQAGPEMWIILILAFLGATTWNAWQKQKKI